MDTPASSPPSRTLPAMSKPDRGRLARLEVRMKPEEKAMIEQAAAYGGEDVSTFVRRVALVEARALLAKVGK